MDTKIQIENRGWLNNLVNFLWSDVERSPELFQDLKTNESKRSPKHFIEKSPNQFIEKSPNQFIKKGYNQFIEKGPRPFTDLKFECQDGSIRAHSALLQTICPLLRIVFSDLSFDRDEELVVIVPDFKVETVRKFLELVYTGKSELNGPNEFEEVKEFGFKQLGFFMMINWNVKLEKTGKRLNTKLDKTAERGSPQEHENNVGLSSDFKSSNEDDCCNETKNRETKQSDLNSEQEISYKRELEEETIQVEPSEISNLFNSSQDLSSNLLSTDLIIQNINDEMEVILFSKDSDFSSQEYSSSFVGEMDESKIKIKNSFQVTEDSFIDVGLETEPEPFENEKKRNVQKIYRKKRKGNIGQKKEQHFTKKEVETKKETEREVLEKEQRKKEEMQKNPNKYGTIECNVCKEILQSYIQLKIHHNEVHKNMKPFECEKCNGKYAYRSQLQAHFKSKHLGQRPFQCRFCKIRFAHSGHLNRHVQGVHEKRKPFQCILCKAMFSERGSVKKHMKSIHCQ